MRISDWSSDVCSSDLLTMSRNAHTSLTLCWTGDERCQGDDRGPFVVRSCGTVKRRFCGAGRKANAMLDFLSRHNPRGLVARFIAAPAALPVLLVLYGTLGIGDDPTPDDGCDASAPAPTPVPGIGRASGRERVC